MLRTTRADSAEPIPLRIGDLSRRPATPNERVGHGDQAERTGRCRSSQLLPSDLLRGDVVLSHRASIARAPKSVPVRRGVDQPPDQPVFRAAVRRRPRRRFRVLARLGDRHQTLRPTGPRTDLARRRHRRIRSSLGAQTLDSLGHLLHAAGHPSFDRAARRFSTTGVGSV